MRENGKLRRDRELVMSCTYTSLINIGQVITINRFSRVKHKIRRNIMSDVIMIPELCVPLHINLLCITRASA